MGLPSALIRQTLPGHRRTLQNRIDQAKEKLQEAIASTPEELATQEDDLAVLSQLISKSIEKINALDAQWLELLENIAEEKILNAEQQQYQQTALHDSDGYQRQLEEAETVAIQINQRISRLQTVAHGLRTLPEPGVQTGESVSGTSTTPVRPSNVNNPQSGTTQASLRLPKLTLPKFNGDVLKFPEFWSIFDSAIHSRSDLTPVAKLSYLLPQLEGAAAQAIQGYQLLDSNYDLIIARLKERFERSGDRYISMLHAELKRISACSMRFEDRRKTLDACERVFRQLEQAGQSLDPGQSLVFDLLSKFPARMICELDRRYRTGVYSTLSELRSALEKYMSEEELTMGFLQDLLPNKQGSEQKSSRKNASDQAGFNGISETGITQGQYPQSERTLAAQSRVVGKGPMSAPPSSCYFCSGNHFNDKCQKYPSGHSRLQRLTHLGRCKRCMGNHDSRTGCIRKIWCHFCRAENKHQSPLCFFQFPDKTSNFRQGVPRESPKGHNERVFSRNSNVSSKNHRQEPVHLADDATDHLPVGQQDVVQSVGEISNFSSASSKNSLFQTAKVTVQNLSSGEQQRLRICLDTLSNRSYITDKAAKLLNLQSEGEDKLCVAVFGTSKNIEVNTKSVTFGLVQTDGNVCEIQANTTRIISNSNILPRELPETEQKILSSLKHCLADDPFDIDKSVDILIGQDYAWDIIEGPKTALQNCDIFMIPSVFGFMLGGQLHYESNSDNSTTLLCITETHCQFPNNLGLIANDSAYQASYPDIDEYWNLESIGIKECPVQNDDIVAQELFDNSVSFQEGRYHVQWPWISEKKALLPSNYDIALTRLNQLTGRLQRNNNLLQTYRDTLNFQVESGIIEEVPLDEVDTENVTHYLPHHPVIKPNRETTKVRIVYDASCKSDKNALSLNDCMYRGPVILPDLCQLLIRFRTSPVVIISDIEKAFLQVALQKPDRDVTRFLWYHDDNNPSTNPGNLKVMRFSRVAFGIISSPFLLAAVINHHLKQEGSEFALSLMSDIYVDNIISCVPENMSPLDYYTEIKRLFAQAGMNVQAFCSNSKNLMEQIPPKDRVHDVKTKVLGLKWNSVGDDTLFLIRPTRWDKTLSKYTKRIVLCTIASIFDPLGLFQPATFPAKVFLQSLWASETQWDEPLSGRLCKDWSVIRSSLDSLFEIRIPRWIGKVDDASTLIVFSDASTKGYGTAVYVRSPDGQSKFSTHLIFAKSRLAPIPKRKSKLKDAETVSLPRLELLGVSIAVNAAKFCKQALRFPEMKIHIFTDSECVLHWIRSNRLLKRFVARRIEQIKSLTDCTFHYVGTGDNPADLLTRGIPAQDLNKESKWWHGPEWLKNPETAWPETRLPPVSSETLHEYKPDKPVTFAHVFVAAEASANGPLGIPFDRFSSLLRLIRVTWVCLTFLRYKLWDKLTLGSQQLKPFLESVFDTVGQKPFSPESYQAILRMWIRSVQETSYSAEISSIQKQKSRPLVKQLNLKLDEHGLLRTHSRYQHADLPRAARHPVLLPKNHNFSKLIVFDIHLRLKHAGPIQTLSELRSNFWIPHGREYVKKVLKSCQHCRRYRTAQPFQLPPMPPWPVERVCRSAPFQFVGVDYFGPLKVKVYDVVHKMWTCLFTCLSTRAIHMEPVTDCTPDEFLKSLSRFVSRRGAPQEIISDNAAQFRLTKILADRAWTKIPKDDSILTFAAQHGIRWKFIVELAPWQGGHYERLVGVVKSLLKTTVGRRLLTWSDVVTLLTEIEAVVNSRPITYVNNEHDSGYRILRPVDFLLYRPVNSLPISDTSFPVRDLGEGTKLLAVLWKHREKYLNKLWSVWYDEYLLSLRERTSLFHRGGRARVDRVPEVGEVVLVREENTQRGAWKLARITTLIHSTDSNVRAAEVQLANGVKLRRSISFLIPLEAGSVQPLPDQKNSNQTDMDTAANPVSVTEQISQQTSNFRPDNDTTNEESETDNGFEGFSQDDILRTVNLLRLYDDATDQLREQ